MRLKDMVLMPDIFLFIKKTIIFEQKYGAVINRNGFVFLYGDCQYICRLADVFLFYCVYVEGVLYLIYDLDFICLIMV